MADKQTLQWLTALVWLGIGVNALLILIDMKLKNDILEELGGGPVGQAGDRQGNWIGAKRGNAPVFANPNLRFAARTAETAPDIAPAPGSATGEDADDSGPLGGSGDQGIPQGDE
jgi:hypothetical protein